MPMRNLLIACTAEPKDRMRAEVFGGEIQISAARSVHPTETTIVLDVAKAELLAIWLAEAVKRARNHVLEK